MSNHHILNTVQGLDKYPHHLELQVINFSNFYSRDDHKNSVVNSQDLIEEIPLHDMTY